MRLRTLSAVTALLATGCPKATPSDGSSSRAEPATSSTASAPTVAAAPFETEPAKDARLEIRLSIAPDVVMDRVPMHTATLHFRNVSDEPVRLYLPVGEPFRYGISTIVLRGEGNRPLTVPEPRPHGYQVTEKDFHLLGPGESKTFEQRFTLDPLALGGKTTQRRPGYELGKAVAVSWTYRNSIRRWEGGKPTLDGPTETLFGGEEIPHIWTGKLSVKGSWTVPR